MVTKSDPMIRGYADALIGLETTINYVLEMAAQQGIEMRLEAEVVNQPHLSSRIHLRLMTPDMEVMDDLSTDEGKAALGAVAGEAAG